MGGNAFRARAPPTGNARLPSEDWRVAGTTTSVLEAKPATKVGRAPSHKFIFGSQI